VISPQETRVTLIGLDVVGAAMANNLVEAGYALCVFDDQDLPSTPDVARELELAGAEWAQDMAEACQDAQVIIVAPHDPVDVEELFMGDDGILEFAEEGAYLLNMSTCSPRLSYEIYACAAVGDQTMLDAPITGGDTAAARGELGIYVGGDESAFREVEALLQVLGKRVLYMGASGQGQLAKICNQVALAGSLVGAMESLALAKLAGMDPAKLLDGIRLSDASSWTLYDLAPKSIKRDYSSGFFMSRFIQEIELALELADSLELTLPGMEATYQLLDLLCTVGGGELGLQALSLLYEEEEVCAAYGLDWSKAEDLYDGEDEDDCGCDDEDCGHDHHHHHDHDHGHVHPDQGQGFRPGPGPAGFGGIMGSFFSPN